MTECRLPYDTQGAAAEEGEDQAEGPAHAQDPNAQPAPSISARLREAAANVADQASSQKFSCSHIKKLRDESWLQSMQGSCWDI